MIEPGPYATDFGKASSSKVSAVLEPYAPLRQHMISQMATMVQGDPHATAAAVLALVDAEVPPLRFLLGSTALPRLRNAYDTRIKLWEQWSELSNSAQGTLKVTAGSH